MRISIAKDALKDALSAACRATAEGNSSPELACVLVEAGGDGAVIEATDGTFSVRASAAALVEEEGRALVPAARLASLVRALPDGAVALSADSRSASVSCAQASAVLPALDPAGFPAFPRVGDGASVTLPFEPLSAACARAARFAEKPGKDGKGGPKCGVLFEWSGGELRVVATDGLRVSIERLPVAGGGEGSVVAPARLAADAAALDCTRTATLACSGRQVVLRVGGCTLVARRIEGDFPNWRMLDEVADPAATAVFDRGQLLGAARRALAIGRGPGAVGISLKGEGLPAVVERDLGAEGRSVDEVECAHASGSHEACASPVFLVEALAAVPDDVVSVALGGGRKPIMFRTLSGSYRQAVMPVVLPKGR